MKELEPGNQFFSGPASLSTSTPGIRAFYVLVPASGVRCCCSQIFIRFCGEFWLVLIISLKGEHIAVLWLDRKNGWGRFNLGICPEKHVFLHAQVIWAVGAGVILRDFGDP
jgi:hypothetical protein